MNRTPILITVPKYVAISSSSSGNNSSGSGSDAESCVDEFLVRSGTKRKRLDHLTWEEKLQRKKLKNRVAAQTSRDRKKAKMEDMEQTIQDLSDQNAHLQTRCDTLQEQNDKLVLRNNDLEKRLQDLEKKFESQAIYQQNQNTTVNSSAKTFGAVGCEITTTGSAAGCDLIKVDSSKCDGKEQRDNVSTVEDSSTLPSLQDLLLGDFDLSGLEELAESLLSDVTTELEGDFSGSCNADATPKGTASGMSERMVGTTTEQLESSQNINRSVTISTTHQNSTKSTKPETKSQSTIKHLKNITTTSTSETSAPPPTSTSKTSAIIDVMDVDDMIIEDDGTDDSFYGTYDEKTNSITVVVSDESIPVVDTIDEIICDDVTIEELDETENDVEIPLKTIDNESYSILSPLPTSEKSISINHLTMPSPLHSIFSDSDYESLGSPNEHEINDLWNNTSFLELFPSAV